MTLFFPSPDLSAESPLNAVLWNAQGTTFTGYLNAIRNADSTSYDITFDERTQQCTYDMNLQWCWFDYVDANSYSEYHWNKDEVFSAANFWGVIEGEIDRFFDRVFKCSFHIAIFFDEVGVYP